ncbi:hypothetical protein M0M42_10495 [Pseudomonas knackmussii]|jgi:hypothetical protein|uniref:HicB-like antitoxin of toxin-antitoxin system domain-containing protein n=1 Tax=Pseudomonas knackmussii TaxID=65741 RepID=A0ABY4KZV0_9PSED|nr:hypothetical protein [Pseudomonas knackmussii]UPQ84772.1 hypothetical protein M0M42_10495 [Pseudomonas knackmussii]
MTFTQNGPFVNYYFVMDMKDECYPYGCCGPFADKAEAELALTRIAGAFPSAELRLAQGGFDLEGDEMLIAAQGKAREKLARLAA